MTPERRLDRRTVAVPVNRVEAGREYVARLMTRAGEHRCVLAGSAFRVGVG
jgi:hypothetical protein